MQINNKATAILVKEVTNIILPVYAVHNKTIEATWQVGIRYINAVNNNISERLYSHVNC